MAGKSTNPKRTAAEQRTRILGIVAWLSAWLGVGLVILKHARNALVELRDTPDLADIMTDRAEPDRKADTSGADVGASASVVLSEVA